jgi:hypothetical protein
VNILANPDGRQYGGLMDVEGDYSDNDDDDAPTRKIAAKQSQEFGNGVYPRAGLGSGRSSKRQVRGPQMQTAAIDSLLSSQSRSRPPLSQSHERDVEADLEGADVQRPRFDSDADERASQKPFSRASTPSDGERIDGDHTEQQVDDAEVD